MTGSTSLALPDARVPLKDGIPLSERHNETFQDLVSSLGGQKAKAMLGMTAEFDQGEFRKDCERLRKRMRDQTLGLLQPRGIFIQYWDMVTGMALLYTLFVTTFEVGLDIPTKIDGLFVANQIVALLFLSDICVQFFLPVPDPSRGEGSFERRHVVLAKKYLKGLRASRAGLRGRPLLPPQPGTHAEAKVRARRVCTRAVGGAHAHTPPSIERSMCAPLHASAGRKRMERLGRNARGCYTFRRERSWMVGREREKERERETGRRTDAARMAGWLLAGAGRRSRHVPRVVPMHSPRLWAGEVGFVVLSGLVVHTIICEMGSELHVVNLMLYVINLLFRS